jgi:phosphoribosylanthranilate isomerase
MTQVKICGITQYDDAQVAVEAGADMLGFIFYPPSPRYIAPEHVREIADRLPPDIKTVGVFVNESSERITRIVRTSGVQVVQLHGDEGPDLCQTLSWPVVKAFRFTAQIRPEMTADYDVEAFLVEGFDNRLYGGAGARADWPQVATLHPYGRIILAGGLTPENVQEAIRVVQPYAVDVGSGVEAGPGKKDWQKVRTFVRQAKTANPF